MTERPELICLARSAALEAKLDPPVVCAVIEQESAWNPWAMRYEPAFREHYVAPLRLPVTEEIARSISWGLMQVMGQTAREHGFGGIFLSKLCQPPDGLRVGCEILAQELAAAGNDWRYALQMWNGGANPSYAEEVLARTPHYAAE